MDKEPKRKIKWPLGLQHEDIVMLLAVAVIVFLCMCGTIGAWKQSVFHSLPDCRTYPW